MSDRGGYGQFCPVSMASEVLCTRWTTLVVREMLCGSTRFNDIRRGVPRMSPALLSKRLKQLERAGIIDIARERGGASEYRLTEAGEDLRPIIVGVGNWGQRWIESELTLRNLDPSLLMWDMRRKLNPKPLPPRRCTILFLYPDVSEKQRRWWLVVDEGAVDLCSFDPGFDIDLMIKGPLRAMTAVWMGLTPLRQEIDAGRLEIEGDPTIASAIQAWLGLSTFAPIPRRVA